MAEKSTWTLWYSVEWLREQVQNITAALASRRGEDGKVREHVMMTADNDELFRRLLRDAVSDVRTKLSGIIEPEHPSDEIEREQTVHLHLRAFAEAGTSTQQPTVVRVLDDKVRQYLIARVTFGWLSLVSPVDVEPFAIEMNAALDELNTAAKCQAFTGARRKYRLF